MVQKRVSFKVAKAIKEAGYPQDNLIGLHKIKAFPMYYNGDYVPDYEYMFNNYIAQFDEKLCVACPTYLSVWLWLWREKGIRIQVISKEELIISNDSGITYKREDPEEAIIAAIEYIVDNNLLK